LVEDQVRVEELPLVIELGLAERETVGSGIETGVTLTTLEVAAERPPESVTT
jgi:hypothetical protein